MMKQEQQGHEAVAGTPNNLISPGLNAQQQVCGGISYVT